MNNAWADFDFRAISEVLKENIRQFGGFSPSDVKKAGATGAEKLRAQILRSLGDGPKSGFELITKIGEQTTAPSSSKLYPMLEQLMDEGLLRATVKKDRRYFSLTEEGVAAASSSQPIVVEESDEETNYLPNWVDLRGELPKSLARLGKLSLEVSKYGTKAQQEQAAKAVDEAVKKLHQILASE